MTLKLKIDHLLTPSKKFSDFSKIRKLSFKIGLFCPKNRGFLLITTLQFFQNFRRLRRRKCGVLGPFGTRFCGVGVPPKGRPPKKTLVPIMVVEVESFRPPKIVPKPQNHTLNCFIRYLFWIMV